MTGQQLEAIYKANLSVGHLEALEAVYTHGFVAGAGGVIDANSISVVPTQAAPATIVMFKRPDLR